MKTIEVGVRYYGGVHIARAGKGKSGKTASSTSGPQWAALLAASKYLRPGRAGLTAEPIDSTSPQHATKFIVRKGRS